MAKEFQGPFECIGENSEIYKSFSVPIKKEVIKTKKDEKKSIENISYIIKLIDSIRFIISSLTLHVDNLSEIYNEKCSAKNCKSEFGLKELKIMNTFMIAKSVERNI